VWPWIVVGAGSFLVFSVLVGLAAAAVLGVIGRRVSEWYETEKWATAPPGRAVGEAEPWGEQANEQDRIRSRGVAAQPAGLAQTRRSML
jgi:hypothetical protein